MKTYHAASVPHLANILGIEEKDYEHYKNGIDAWAKEMNTTRAHIIIMLREAGAGKNPISTNQWENSPIEVYKNLCKIEELPSLESADLSNLTLDNIDLSGLKLIGRKSIKYRSNTYRFIKHKSDTCQSKTCRY